MAEWSTRRSLTDELLDDAPAAGHPVVWDAAAAKLPELLAGVAARRGGACRLTDHDIRMALAGAAAGPATGLMGVDQAPFAWSARTARRSLGLASVRALVAGAVRSPAEGVRAAVAQSTRGVRDEQRPTSTMDRWLADLPSAGRAAVGADAVTWATRLWCALDWDAFTDRPVIGRDHWWDSPHSALLALRGRAEVRTEAAHLVVLTGPRRATVRAELSVVALVELLRSRGTSGPLRVVGWWPDSGHRVRVDMEPTVLDLGVETVTQALLGGHTRAAA